MRKSAGRIRTYESERDSLAGQSSSVWAGRERSRCILGAILLACGVVLFVSAHWDEIGPGARYALVMAMVAVFHLGGAATRERFRGLSTALHAVGTVSTGAAIALVGQIFNIQEHWPAAILLWAIAALAGWALLRDEAQQTLTLLLFPAWIFSEFSFAAEGHIGQDVYIGRFLIVWAVLYLTVFLGSKHKIVQGILFAAAAISALVGILLMAESWRSWSGSQTFLPLHTRVWGWIGIAALPLLLRALPPPQEPASSHRRDRSSPSRCPGAVAPGSSTTTTAMPRALHPNRTHHLAAHALVAAFCVFVIWWGVRQTSKALVNLGIVGFAITVVWFYFSDIFDKVGRSLGLIGIGILFLAGGWALEKMRRGLLINHMGQTELPPRRLNEAGRNQCLRNIHRIARHSVGAGLVHRRQIPLSALDLPPCLDTHRGLRSRTGHARPLPEHPTPRRRLPEHAALGKTGGLPAQHQWRSSRDKVRYSRAPGCSLPG